MFGGKKLTSILSVAEMRILLCMIGYARQNRIRNTIIGEKVGLASIVEKTVESLGHSFIVFFFFFTTENPEKTVIPFYPIQMHSFTTVFKFYKLMTSDA